MTSTGRYCAMAGVICKDTDVDGRQRNYDDCGIVSDFGREAEKEACLGHVVLSQ